MRRSRSGGHYAGIAIGVLAAALGCAGSAGAAPVPVAPATMPRLATISERYLSYNVEIAEVIGAKFWKPYDQGRAAQKDKSAAAASSSAGAPFQNAALFEARPPIDLANARLRKLAAALGPAYVRVSGTWANTLYFQDSDAPALASPPKGFQGVLTRHEWRGVIDFAHAVNAKIVTSFAIGEGVRNAAGVWTPNQARKRLAATKSAGGEIAAAEFFNEPTYAAMEGASPGYDAADYARDFAVFRRLARAASPDMRIVGPGSVGEGIMLMPGPMLKTADLLAATPRPVFDIFSYHSYAAASERCATPGSGVVGTTAAAALSPEWLSSADRLYAFYAALRDRFEPGKPIWVTETADTACGGNPWASTFLDSFRFLNELGILARRGVEVIFHNTLAASDYGLLDPDTFLPRPNYWAALLWRRLMGRVVLDAGPSRPGLYLYAQCLRGHPGGVALLAINANRTRTEAIDLPMAAERYTLTAAKLEARRVALNGHRLELGSNGELPGLESRRVPSGRVELAPASITFLAVAQAGNRSCR